MGLESSRRSNEDRNVSAAHAGGALSSANLFQYINLN